MKDKDIKKLYTKDEMVKVRAIRKLIKKEKQIRNKRKPKYSTCSSQVKMFGY